MKCKDCIYVRLKIEPYIVVKYNPNTIFADWDAVDKTIYYCHVLPPSQKGFPEVLADDFCGHFKSKDHPQKGE